MRAKRNWTVLVALAIIAAVGGTVWLEWSKRDIETVGRGLSSPSEQSYEPLPPLIFARDENLWRSDGTGSAPKQLTKVDQGTLATNPAVSPDASRVSYVVLFPPAQDAVPPLPTSKLYVMNVDGSNAHVILNPSQGVINQAAWTPDGQSLYVGITGLRAAPAVVGGMQLSEIVKLDVSTGAIQPVIEDAMAPALSRDGRLLAFLRVVEAEAPDQPSSLALEVSTTDGSQTQQLLDHSMFKDLYAPRFSPDGMHIVFSAAGGPETGEAGTTLRPTTAPASLLRRALAWFTPSAQAHGQPFDLWMIGADGTNLQRLTWANEDQPMAAFASDGRELVMVAGGGIYRLNVDGSQFRKIDPHGGHGGVDWFTTNP